MITIKSKKEIELMQEAGKLTALTYDYIEKIIKPGMSTYELDKLTENYLTEVYSNVKSFKTTDCALEENKLMIEGTITFNSGKTKNTKFDQMEFPLEGHREGKNLGKEKGWVIEWEKDYNIEELNKFIFDYENYIN